ncbi:MAG: NUDIX hydrolase [Gammaproteobacteria bacterium]|nr:NUDIX hydrolase [Gammaproteobacteria bacterium]
MQWTPHVTVAAIIEKNQQFLMVSEKNRKGEIVVNQPAGHLEDNESLVDAIIREMLEETAYDFVPEGLVGCYQWKFMERDTTYLRFLFHGTLGEHHPELELDEGIVSADWFSLEQLQGADNLRSYLVMAGIDDYLAGKRYPVEFISSLTN